MTLDATALETTTSAEGPKARTARGRVVAAWQLLDQLLAYVGDFLNPILVKETRQALKSSQFAITFVLVLIAGWIVTIGVVSYIGPRIYYSAEGGTLLVWYYAVLALPLTVVVPLASFRSLTVEREDNTYDLLSITALKPRQIISGKLGSSMAQMAVYFSAITPCLAFTYLLRGVDLPTIIVLLVYTFFWSLGLSMVGLLLGALTPQRFVQVFILVAFVAGLLFMFWMAIAMGSVAATSGGRAVWFAGHEFWVLTAALATAYFSTFALAYFAAAGMITFTSENRSTPLRICMIAQQVVFIGWMAYFWIGDDLDDDYVFIMAAFSGAYWYVMGTMLTAEQPKMSQRVRRRLPQSFFGRMFFTWLNPGPASGYLFVVANLTSLAALNLLAMTFGGLMRKGVGGSPDLAQLSYFTIVGWSYVVAYLGIGFLVIRALRRVATVTMLASVLIHFLLVLAGFGVPYAIKSMSVTMRDADYSYLQITDPFFSILHLVDSGVSADANFIVLVVMGSALCVLILNMPVAIRELKIVREQAPTRVLEDEAELHPPPEAMPQNPWDER